MVRLTSITLLGMSLLLTGCQPPLSPHLAQRTQDQALEAGSKPAPANGGESLKALPVAPQIGHTLADPTPLFPSQQLDNPWATLPAGTAVPVLVTQTGHVEVQVAIGGTTYRAWARAGDILVGSREDALALIETRKCEASLGRPGSGEILSGSRKNPPPSRISPDYTTDDEFLGLGLAEVQGYDDYTPVPTIREKEGENMVEVTAGPSSDVYVKVKDTSDNEVVGFFIQAGHTEHVRLNDGRYRVFFASGKRFSTSCGRFMTDMHIVKDPAIVSLDGGEKMIYTLIKRPMPQYSKNAFHPAAAKLDEF